MNRKAVTTRDFIWVCTFTFVLGATVHTPLVEAQSRHVQNQTNAAMPRSEEISKLLVVLRDPELRKTQPERVVAAIQRLGEMRATEAVNDLVELLTFARKFAWERDDAIVEIQPITRGNRYPATSALFQIGRPALPALVKVIELNPTDSEWAQNSTFAVQNIFRDNLTEGAQYLERAAESSKNTESAQRLRQSAAELRRLEGQIVKTVTKQ